jgi:hypothetical protein
MFLRMSLFKCPQDKEPAYHFSGLIVGIAISVLKLASLEFKYVNNGCKVRQRTPQNQHWNNLPVSEAALNSVV